VLAVGFSQCGRYVACVSDDENHNVSVYNLERQCRVLSLDGGKSEVTTLAWSKRPNDLRFAVVGPKEIKFWNPADVTKRMSEKGTF